MKRKVVGCLSAFALAFSLQQANASVLGGDVLYSGTALVSGSTAETITLNLPSAGELFMTLTDYNFPNPFASLQFNLSDGSSNKTPLTAAGSLLTWTATGPTTLYANVFATAQGVCDVGLFNLTASFVSTAPVGIPATGVLLASVTALAALLEWACRRRVQVTVTTAMA